MKKTNKRVEVVDVEISKMYNQYIDSHADMMRDDFEFFLTHKNDFVAGAVALGTKDVDAIRKMFHSGETFTLINIQEIEEANSDFPLEVRVWDGDDLLMVLLNNEVNY